LGIPLHTHPLTIIKGFHHSSHISFPSVHVSFVPAINTDNPYSYSDFIFKMVYIIIAKRWGRYGDLRSDQTNIDQGRSRYWVDHSINHHINRIICAICLNIGRKLVKRSLSVKFVLVFFQSHFCSDMIKKKPAFTV
jgi:hypothetical protein